MMNAFADAGNGRHVSSSCSTSHDDGGSSVQQVEQALGASRPHTSEVNLAGVDLNLLVALEALLERCNVTHAANVVGLSQPAMSRALSRLRGLFNDDLLVRTSSGYVRTIRGEQLYDRLPGALAAVRELIASRSAGAEDWRPAFRMAMPDHQALVLLPSVWGQLHSQAINAELVVEPLTAALWKRLENGEIEVAIGQVQDAPNGFFQRLLYEDDYVCLVRRGHPALTEGMWPECFRSLRHAVVAPGHDAECGFAADVLAGVAPQNRVVLSPNTMGAAMAVAESDTVLTVPRRVAVKLSTLLPLQMVDVPVAVPPYRVMLLWHERSHKSAEHGVMRSHIAAATRFGAMSGGAALES